jgi:hypothetical protein
MIWSPSMPCLWFDCYSIGVNEYDDLHLESRESSASFERKVHCPRHQDRANEASLEVEMHQPVFWPYHQRKKGIYFRVNLLCGSFLYHHLKG